MNICVECEYYRNAVQKSFAKFQHNCASAKDPVTGEGKDVNCQVKNKNGKCKDFEPKEQI